MTQTTQTDATPEPQPVRRLHVVGGSAERHLPDPAAARAAAARAERLARPDPAAAASDLALRTGRPVGLPAAEGLPERMPLGQILAQMGAVEPGNLVKALALRERQDVRLGDILLANDWVCEADLMAALAREWQASCVDLIAQAPDPRLIDRIGAELCLARGMVPWRRIGRRTVIATSRPEDFRALKAELPEALGPFAMVLASERDIHAALLARRQTSLVRKAETRVKPSESARTRSETRLGRVAAGLLLGLAAGLAAAPQLLLAALVVWMLASTFLTSALKLAAFLVHRARPETAPPNVELARLPVVSVMVPLFRERDIADRLVARLSRLIYPRELLDVILVVEATDRTTIEALAGTTLPRWMRVVEVPDGPIKTKPRALNYALNFCRGTVIGVYDAEDAPDPDQLHKIVRRFARRGPDVACLQGQLDYYNPRTNWLARCFTIEYAAWFRAMLPGVAKMGLLVPLGGTTLFFRREALEHLGGWDAHNVTEDADLGVRLARYGYRTELVETTTHEEANCRARPWIKQRSRWLKGYAITWGVHMRDPVALWRDLGAWRFWGFQVQFFGTLSQYLLLPLTWTFWAIPLGLWHPVSAWLSPGWTMAAMIVFFFAEIANSLVALWAVRGRAHRHLVPWVATLGLYFPLGAAAGWKAIYEVLVAPFYWDKTVHGLFDAPGLAAAAQEAAETQAEGLPPLEAIA